MKVTMLAVGSRGDVQPYVALGKGLQAAGYEVMLATHNDFADFVRGNGLEFHNLGGNVREMLETEAGREVVAGGSNPLPFLLHLRKMMRDMAGEFLERSRAACEGADAIIYAIFALSGYQIGEKMGIPTFPALLQPITRTRYFPLQPPPRGSGSAFYNLSTYVGAQQLFGQLFGDITNKWRRQLRLPALPRAGFYSLLDRRHLPILYGYSPTLVPKPRDWGSWLHVTGHWFLDSATDWAPPADLVNFIARDEPPIYIGFGSMPSRDPQATADLAITALRKAGRRGILLSGWGGMAPQELGDDIFLIDGAPHDWLFPRMAAVVHHGGAGTSGAGARSGRPSLALPFFGDQYFWADRLSRLGIGPKYIPRDRLTVDNLAAALSKAVGDETIRRRAEWVGQRIRAEDGIGQAVAAFRQEMAKAGRAA